MPESEAMKGILQSSCAQTMMLTSMLNRLRAIPGPTIRTVVRRLLAQRDRFVWLDMKIDPVTGRRRKPPPEYYRRDRVYGWIQGRGLESMAAHLKYAKAMNGYWLVDVDRLREAGDSLYATVKNHLAPEKRVRAAFVMNTDGRPLVTETEMPSGKWTTLTQLFVLRGLYAWAQSQCLDADLEWITPQLEQAVDAILAGWSLNDQILLNQADSNTAGSAAIRASRKGYECFMIALGACILKEDWKRANTCIDAVLSSYYYRSPSQGPLLLDEPLKGANTESAGAPLRTSNPGHTIEFAGLALQCLRLSAPTSDSMLKSQACNPDSRIAILRSLALNAFERYRAPHGGIVRQICADTGTILDAHCPWWSMFEAVRTLSELFVLPRAMAGDPMALVPETEAHAAPLVAGAPAEEGLESVFPARQGPDILSDIASCLDSIEGAYLAPSKTGIPVQTLSFEGKVVPFIPATPDIDPGYHTGIPLIQAYELLASMAGLQAGTAQSRIPPMIGAPLQGHIARTGPAVQEIDPLKVRALWLASPWTSILIVSADVLEFDTAWAARVQAHLSRRFHIPEHHILLSATHVHTAPPAISLAGMEPDTAFLQMLESAIQRACSRAMRKHKPVAPLPLTVLVPGIGINRRSIDPQSGRILMRPNPEGDRDDEVRALFFLDARRKPVSVLLNTAVHPTTLSVSIHGISADYPGRAAAYLSTKLRRLAGASAPVVLLQGTCGDVRPMLLTADGKEFVEGSTADIRRLGRKLAKAVYDEFSKALNSNVPLPACEPHLTIASTTLELPLEPLPSREELCGLVQSWQTEARAKPAEYAHDFLAAHDNQDLLKKAFLKWGRDLLDKGFDEQGSYIGPRNVSAPFSLISIGSAAMVFTLPGEAFSAISARLRTIFAEKMKELGDQGTNRAPSEHRAPSASPAPPLLLISGYCNGTVGYMPTAQAFTQGGYEVESAYRLYGLPAPLSPSTESLVLSAFRSLLDAVLQSGNRAEHPEDPKP